MPILKQYYLCEYGCNKRYANKYKMIEHEDLCWHNEKNKTCVTCEHRDFEWDNEENKVKSFYCREQAPFNPRGVYFNMNAGKYPHQAVRTNCYSWDKSTTGKKDNYTIKKLILRSE